MKIRLTILIALIVICGLSSAFIIQAQTWIGPKTNPITAPVLRSDNSEVKNIADLGGDDLGDHTADHNLNMNGKAMFGVNATGVNEPAVDIISATGNGTGLNSISTSVANGTAIYAHSEGSNATVWARNNSNVSGYALRAANSGAVDSYGALIYGQVALPLPAYRLIIGSNDNDSLGIQAAANDTTNLLYWGNQLLCDPTQVNCGFAASGSITADNMGNSDPHTATMALNLNNFKLYNVASDSSAAALAVTNSGTAIGAFIENKVSAPLSAFSTAVYAETKAPSVSIAGIYGVGATGPGVKAASAGAGGLAAKIYGRLNIAADIDDILFETDANALGIQSETGAATNDLYWGNRLLCKKDQPNCGWNLSAGSAFWKQSSYPANIYYDDGYVGVGVPLPAYQLDVADTAEASVASLGNVKTVNLDNPGRLGVAHDIYVQGGITVDTAGAVSQGSISLGATGLKIGTATLSESDLAAIIATCISVGACTP